MENDCCKTEETCCQVSPEVMCKTIAEALMMANKFKQAGGIGGREVSLVVTHLEDAWFRAGRYCSEIDVSRMQTGFANVLSDGTGACKA